MDGIAVEHIITTAKKAGALPEPKVITGEGFAYLIQPEIGNDSRAWVLRDVPHRELRPEPIKLHTLTGLVDYLKSNRDELTLADCMLHVVNEKTVLLVSKVTGVIPERTRHVIVEFATLIGGDGFNFGKFLDPEWFTIALQTLFEDTDDRAAVLACAGNMREDLAKTVNDDGVTQAVAARAGVALLKPMTIPNPVTLRPFRTFREVKQPSSKFVFRVRGGGEGKLPECALFEADGGAWKLEAIKNIRQELEFELTPPAEGGKPSAPLVTIVA